MGGAAWLALELERTVWWGVWVAFRSCSGPGLIASEAVGGTSVLQLWEVGEGPEAQM